MDLKGLTLYEVTDLEALYRDTKNGLKLGFTWALSRWVGLYLDLADLGLPLNVLS